MRAPSTYSEPPTRTKNASVGLPSPTRPSGIRSHAKRRGAYIATVAAVSIAPITWGSTYYVATEWLPPDRPLFAATVRALPAGLLLVALSWALPSSLRWWFRIAVLGVLNIGAFFALLFVSANHLPGGVAATLGAIQPLVVACLSHAVLAEKITGRAVGTGLLGIVGVGLLVLRGNAQLDLAGVAAGLLGAISMASGVVLAKRWGRPPGMSTITHTGWMLTLGGMFLCPLMAVIEGVPSDVDGRNLVGFTYLVLINTALAYSLWMWGIARLRATQVTFLGLLSPAVATLLGWVALKESLTPLQAVGLAIALSSVVAAQSRPRDRGVAPQASSIGPGPRPIVGSIIQP